MATRIVYLSDELNTKLKEEKNVSRLVQNLLNDYYKHNVENIEEINAKIKEVKAEATEDTKRKDTELQRLSKMKKAFKVRLEKEKEERLTKEEREESAKVLRNVLLEEIKRQEKEEEDVVL